MGDYRFFGPKEITMSDKGVMTRSNVIESNPIDTTSFQSTSFQAIWTGNPTGVLSVLASLDGTHYSDIGASILNNPAGCPGSTYIPVYAACAKWIKLRYTNTQSGQMGTLRVWAMSKTR